MPIANCWVHPNCDAKCEDLIALWSKFSGQSSEHMTVNICQMQQQFGHAYQVTATLILPTLWQSDSISLLQLGLAKALIKYYGLKAKDVMVITQLVESGCVVEGENELNW
ncbi:MAG: hypothetical protein HWE39_15940 [Oceanospirillaceae bacterium]|nr:hypothetical protein [Oceanospirillaceae bacterium]